MSSSPALVRQFIPLMAAAVVVFAVSACAGGRVPQSILGASTPTSASGVAASRAIDHPAAATSSARSVGDSDQTISFTQSQVIITAPAGATALTVRAIGGSGGSDGAGDHVGGLGAVVSTTIPVTSVNQQFAVMVGGQGSSGPDSGGWQGQAVGGSGSGVGNGASGGGGAATTIQMWDPNTQSGAPLIVAAGGGGAGSNGASAGGDGGNSGQNPSAGAGGSGMQPGAGGQAGTLMGMPPWGQNGNQAQNAVAFGGGGGAGYSGGNGGTSSQYGGGGGGGAGFCFLDPTLYNTAVQTADESGNGQVTVQWVTS